MAGLGWEQIVKKLELLGREVARRRLQGHAGLDELFARLSSPLKIYHVNLLSVIELTWI